MTIYYLTSILEALIVFAGFVGGAAVICMFAEEVDRMRNRRDEP